MTINHECPFCNQMQMIVVGDENFSERQRNHLAALQCSCDEARAYQEKANMTTYAEAAIKDFFKDDSDSVRQTLLDLLPKLADWTVERISVKLEGGVSAVLKRKDGSIGVERIETLKKVKG